MPDPLTPPGATTSSAATTLTVLAPVSGSVLALSAVDDPVFATEMVGPGLAVDPDRVTGGRVLAPVAGTVRKLHPHAFVLLTEDGHGVLVHLGIDTVQLHGAGFVLHVTEGAAVAAGDLLVTWDPGAVARTERSPVCPVVALQADPATVTLLVEPGDVVVAGHPLLALD